MASPQQLWQEQKPALIAAAVALVAALSSLVVVPETEQAVVLRFGEPMRVINRFKPNVDYGQTGAGVSFRIPFAERLVRIDKRDVHILDAQALATYRSP